MPITSSTRLFHCLRCRRQVMVCQPCDHGQRYCAHKCRQHARKEACNRAQLKYRNSRKGRLNNAQRQHRFQQRQKEKPEIVMHQTSLSLPANDLLIEKQVANIQASKTPKRYEYTVCHFCGRHGGDLFRVGFLKKRTPYPYQPRKRTGERLNDP